MPKPLGLPSMLKRAASFQGSVEPPFPGKRIKFSRRVEARPDVIADWLRIAAAEFIECVPSLEWAGGFYSWGTWLQHLCKRDLWCENEPWLKLIHACRESDQVRGAAALYRVKTDLVSSIINCVYRVGEISRVNQASKQPSAERDIMRRVRAVVTRQRRHDPSALTLIRLLDLAFILSAYVDCRLANSDRAVHAEQVRRQIDRELYFLDRKPDVKVIEEISTSMEQYMRRKMWLPWYEEVPSVRSPIVIKVRESASEFCRDLPYPRMDVAPGGRGLSRDHLASSDGLDRWLISLLDPANHSRWEALRCTHAHAEGYEEEDAVLEELSRRVVEKALERVLEHGAHLDNAQSKLVDAIPGIVDAQSYSSSDRLTFRQFLELYIYLHSFRTYLVSTFYRQGLPSLKDIHDGVTLFWEIADRMSDLRSLVHPVQQERIMSWMIRTVSRTDGLNRVGQTIAKQNDECLRYERAAIGAILGRVFIRFNKRPWHFRERGLRGVSSSDPLTYAAVIAEWDPALASKIIDASIRIGDNVRAKFASGHGEGLDLYIYRRIIVCDAAIERCAGDLKAAGDIVAKLYPVWDTFEDDKAIGTLDRRGVDFITSAIAERGNFEAQTFYGLLLSSVAWAEQRHHCHLEENIELGMRLVVQAFQKGDVAAALDLVNLIQTMPTHLQKQKCRRLVQEAMVALQAGAKSSAVVSLLLGYIYSTGAPGVGMDTVAASEAYERVLEMDDVTASLRAHAANNLAVLCVVKESCTVQESVRAVHYLRLASEAGNWKAKTNLAAMYSKGVLGLERDAVASRELYRDFFAWTEGSQPACVFRKKVNEDTMCVAEVLVDRSRQQRFCESIEDSSVPLQSFGQVLRREDVPFATVSL